MGREQHREKDSDCSRSLIFGLKPVLEVLRSRGSEVARIEIASGRNEKSVAGVLDSRRPMTASSTSGHMSVPYANRLISFSIKNCVPFPAWW